MGINEYTEQEPPLSNRVHRKPRRVTRRALFAMSRILGDVIYPIGNSLCFRLVGKIIGRHFLRGSLRFPFLSFIIKVADELGFLSINADDRLSRIDESCRFTADKPHLSVSIW